MVEQRLGAAYRALRTRVAPPLRTLPNAAVSVAASLPLCSRDRRRSRACGRLPARVDAFRSGKRQNYRIRRQARLSIQHWIDRPGTIAGPPFTLSRGFEGHDSVKAVFCIDKVEWGTMAMRIASRDPLMGAYRSPPSKPETQRALVLASLAEGVTTIQSPLYSAETLLMIDACRAIGAEVACGEEEMALGAKAEWSHAGSTLEVDCTDLPDGVDAAFDLRDCPNILPTVAAMAATVRGRVRLTGGRLTQLHKSRRIDAMAAELANAGVGISVLCDAEGAVDGLEIRGNSRHPGGTHFSTYGDHRILMSLALFALACSEYCYFDDGNTYDSFPNFFGFLGLSNRSGREPAR